MTRRDLLGRALALTALGLSVRLPQAQAATQPQRTAEQELAMVDLDGASLTPQDGAALRQSLQPLRAATAGARAAGGGRRRRPGAGAAGAAVPGAASANVNTAAARDALIGLACVVYQIGQRSSGGESVEAFRTKLQAEIGAHELTAGSLWRIERMVAEFVKQSGGARGAGGANRPAGDGAAPTPGGAQSAPPGPGGRRRRPGAGGAAGNGSAATGGAPTGMAPTGMQAAMKRLLHEVQSLTLSLMD